MIPLLIPRHRKNELQETLSGLASHFQIREIDESTSTPGDMIFPSLSLACVVVGDGMRDDFLDKAKNIMQRRRCLVLVPQELFWEIQYRYTSSENSGDCSMMMEFDIDCGCVLGFKGSDGLAKVLKAYIKGMTIQYNSDPIST